LIVAVFNQFIILFVMRAVRLNVLTFLQINSALIAYNSVAFCRSFSSNVA